LANGIEKMNRPASTLLVIGRAVALAQTLAWFRLKDATGSGTPSTG
jgi:hypothetical protein